MTEKASSAGAKPTDAQLLDYVRNNLRFVVDGVQNARTPGLKARYTTLISCCEEILSRLEA